MRALASTVPAASPSPPPPPSAFALRASADRRGGGGANVAPWGMRSITPRPHLCGHSRPRETATEQNVTMRDTKFLIIALIGIGAACAPAAAQDDAALIGTYTQK